MANNTAAVQTQPSSPSSSTDAADSTATTTKTAIDHNNQSMDNEHGKSGITDIIAEETLNGHLSQDQLESALNIPQRKSSLATASPLPVDISTVTGSSTSDIIHSSTTTLDHSSIVVSTHHHSLQQQQQLQTPSTVDEPNSPSLSAVTSSTSRLSKLRSRASQVMQSMMMSDSDRSQSSKIYATTSRMSIGGVGNSAHTMSTAPSASAGGNSLGINTSTTSIRLQRSSAPLSAPSIGESSSSVFFPATSSADNSKIVPIDNNNNNNNNRTSTSATGPVGGNSGFYDASSPSSPISPSPSDSPMIGGAKVNQRRTDDDGVAVGTKISEGHSAYVLMYDMLTGIRNAVSRCVAKPYRPLEKADFKGRHKLTFDILGNELTPSSKYEFKFKDYAPWVFRYIREHFKIEAADYLVSLTSKYCLSELGSPGKSGSFFYFSQDYRFIIKTIHHTEHKFLCKILENYYEYIQKNPNTLLSRYYGLHRVKLPHGSKIHFVVMGNVFPPHRDIHEKFDLKGSLIGRYTNEDSGKGSKSDIVQKDLNWLAKQRRLHLGPEKSRVFMEQLEKDSVFLINQNIMDYSLLLGVHYIKRGNSEKLRDKSLSVYEPNPHTLTRQPISSKKSKNDTNIRRILASSGLVQLGPSSNKLPDETPTERKGCIFYDDDGGFLATDENNFALLELYYLGIIDILTPYNATKRAEHAFKSLTEDKDLISAVSPKKYGTRFVKFMKTHVVGHADLDETEKKLVNTVTKGGINSEIPSSRSWTDLRMSISSQDSPRHSISSQTFPINPRPSTAFEGLSQPGSASSTNVIVRGYSSVTASTSDPSKAVTPPAPQPVGPNLSSTSA